MRMSRLRQWSNYFGRKKQISTALLENQYSIGGKKERNSKTFGQKQKVTERQEKVQGLVQSLPSKSRSENIRENQRRILQIV